MRAPSYYRIRDLSVLAIIGVVSVLLFKSFFIIGMPTSQFSGCLSQKIFLVSKSERQVVRGGMYAVNLDRDLRIAKSGSKLIKIVAAKGGDPESVVALAVIPQILVGEPDPGCTYTEVPGKQHLDLVIQRLVQPRHQIAGLNILLDPVAPAVKPALAPARQVQHRLAQRL